jgi:polyisoprenoid-binding protein YceI
VKTLDTGDGKPDKDLNKSMESNKYPTMRFELTGLTPAGGSADTAAVRLQGKLTLHGVTRDVTLPGQVWKTVTHPGCAATSRSTWATMRSAG